MKNCRDLRLGGHQGRDSTLGASIPIWANGAFKQARVRPIRGITELLAAMGIIRKLDITVRFGRDQFNVGQIEWEMMTFNAKHRWGAPLVPTARAYSKLNEYFGKLQCSEIEVSQAQGEFGGKFNSSRSFTSEKETIPKEDGMFRKRRFQK